MNRNLNERTSGSPSNFQTRSNTNQGTLSTLISASSSGWATTDVKEYLTHYPRQAQNLRARKNIDFYQNRIRSSPSPSGTIDEIHKKWKGDYDLLESHHAYIQWIFPIREDGLNSQAQKLYLHEIEVLRQDPEARKRLIRSYDMMLDFYGMRIVDLVTGEIGRTEGYANRYRHLNRSTHNYLRITRILKCLGELGFERLKLGFLLHIVRELADGALSTTSVGRSARDYWFPILRSKDDQSILQGVIKELKAQESEASVNGQGPVRLSDARIKRALQEARQLRLQAQNDDDLDGNDNGDAQEQKSDASSSPPALNVGHAAASSSSSRPASDELAKRFGSPSDSDCVDDSDVDSPRAADESMLPSRGASMDSMDLSYDRTEPAGVLASSPSPAASSVVSSSIPPAATGSSSSASSITGKRKADSDEMEDSPRHQKTPKATDGAQATVQQCVGEKPTTKEE